MPKRILDGEAMWGSRRLGSLPEPTQDAYAWLHSLADSCGVFEFELNAIWHRVAVNRPKLTLKRLEEHFKAFQKAGLLFVWKVGRGQYGYWTGSEIPGRLPALTHRGFERTCGIDVPFSQVDAYLSDLGYPAEPRGKTLGKARGKPSAIQDETSRSTSNDSRDGLALALDSALALERSGASAPPPSAEKSTREKPDTDWIELLASASEIYRETFPGRDPRWGHEADTRLIELAKTGVGVDEFCANYRRFLASEKKFHKEKRHVLRWFVDNFPEFTEDHEASVATDWSKDIPPGEED